MSKYIVETTTTVSLRSKTGKWLFEHKGWNGDTADITTIEWVPPSPVVRLLGWVRERERRWDSVLPFSEISPDIREALKNKMAVVGCPDGGTCHHSCLKACFRVQTCVPLSGVYKGDDWPAKVASAHAADTGTFFVEAPAE